MKEKQEIYNQYEDAELSFVVYDNLAFEFFTQLEDGTKINAIIKLLDEDQDLTYITVRAGNKYSLIELDPDEIYVNGDLVYKSGATND